MKKFFKNFIECIKISLAWLFTSVIFFMCDAFLFAQTPDLTGLLKKIIFIILIIINISYILVTIYCFLSFFLKKLVKYVYDDVLGTAAIIYGSIYPATLYYFYLTRTVLKTPFKEFTLLLPFIMIFIYVFVSVFCYYKAKRDYPDEKIISINLGHFPCFL